MVAVGASMGLGSGVAVGLPVLSAGGTGEVAATVGSTARDVVVGRGVGEGGDVGGVQLTSKDSEAAVNIKDVRKLKIILIWHLSRFFN